jgi:hypothetical protein
MTGLVGAVFKFQLSFHSYTVMAKGIEVMSIDSLKYGHDTY